MPVAKKITYADLRTALTQLGSNVSFPAVSFPDTDDCLLGISDVLNALVIAQTAQNNFAATGEDVSTVTVTEGATVTVEDPSAPGTNISVQPRIYTVSFNVERTINRVLPVLV
ncbi:MAG: hypothetical protein ACKPEN_03160 [Planktothrix sp.]|uniref:hypothetical protein n=1 Tax=Planktothrix sp. TaxID=3088171 RepID=UPI0038D373D3